MRSVMFVLLVGCGGGSKSAPPPISNQPSPDTGPMVAENPKPTCTEATPKCAVATMDYYSHEMCGCKDKVCAGKVNDELTKWGTEMAKIATPMRDEKPDVELAKKSADIMTRYTECLTKLMMDGAQPPPDPCAGGADPCGG
jgi:hypothetical protein